MPGPERLADRCAACGGEGLVVRFRVAGEPGSQGLIPTTDRFGVALADIARCQACGHMQLSPMPAAAVLDAAYEVAASADYLEEQAGQRATARRQLARIARHRAPGVLLDVGCWLGFLLDEARSAGWQVVGVEPSAYAAAYARDVLALDVREGVLGEVALEQDSFDAVVLGDVIEHLPDPAATLDGLVALLRPGGVLIATLPDAGSRVARLLGRRWWSVIPTHVQYFTRRSLRTLLERRGWRVLELDTAPKAFTVAYYCGRIGVYAPRLGRALAAAARLLGGADRVVAPDLRDRLVVVARRPLASSVADGR